MNAPLKATNKGRLRASTAHVNRRMVDMTRVRAPVRHLVLPGHETATTDLRDGETVHALVKRTGWAQQVGRVWSFRLPTIAVLNGKPILQKAWRRIRLRADDVLEFWSKPHGGRGGAGKQILGLVAVIALAAFAPWAAVNVFGLAAGSWGATLVSGLITLGGALLISALTAPKPGGTNDFAQQNVDPIYSVAAGGNTEALLQPIPVQYGRVKSFPNFAITPWSEFIGNDQYLNVLLSVGLGKHSYETLYIDDTILWDSTNGVSASFSGVDVAFYDPNANVTLFPTNVTQASEVSGQTLSTTPVGGFVANAAGSTASAIAVDMTFPGGCFTVDSETGNLNASTVTVVAEVQPVDDAGAPIGGWSSLFTQTYTFATRNPQRVSQKVSVGAGRYQVRVRRTTAELNGTSGSNSVVWSGLRAFINGPSSFPVSTVAIRIKANDQISQGAARKFGVLCTRLLPVWDGSTWVTQATRSPGWAFYDAATNTDYGAGRPASKIDFQGVYDLATAAASRGDTFDFRFSSAVAAPSAFDTILKSTRARHRWSGDMLTVVRDEWSDTPRMLLTDREIVRNSLSIDYALNTDNDADAVILEYLDENTWLPADVQYPPNTVSFTAVQPSRIRIDGVVNRDHAYREAAFYYLCSQLRRVTATLDTEHDGRMLGFGSRVRVQTELPQTWGYSGVVAVVSGNTFTLSPSPTWTTGQQHYIAIRDKTGRQFGPVKCSRGTDDSQAALDPTDLAAVESAQGKTLADALARRDGAEDPSFDFGPGSLRARDCVVVSGRPSGDRVTLSVLVDNSAVHDTDLGGTPVAPSVPALRDPTAPLISGLNAVFRQGVAEPILDASWWPASGAQYYLADVSYDGGASWTNIYNATAASLSAVVSRANLKLRVRGVGALTGPTSTVDVLVPDITIAPGTVDSSSLKDGLHDYVTNQLSDVNDKIRTFQQLISSLASEQDAGNFLDKASLRNQIHLEAGGLSGQVDEVMALAETLDGKITGLWAVTVDVNGHITGIQAFNDGNTGAVVVNTDIFQVALPDTTGGDPVAVFTIAEVNGTPKIVLRGDMIADGDITANKLNVATLTAISAAFGNATVSGTLSSRSSGARMVQDFTNNRMVFYDA